MQKGLFFAEGFESGQRHLRGLNSIRGGREGGRFIEFLKEGGCEGFHDSRSTYCSYRTVIAQHGWKIIFFHYSLCTIINLSISPTILAWTKKQGIGLTLK